MRREAIVMVAFWLLPERRAAEFFSAMVHDLAAEFDAPPFEPHVTVFVAQLEPAAAVGALEQISVPSPLELQLERIAHSAEFTKTLFLQFRPHAQLQQLNDRIRALLCTNKPYELNAHLSLIYKNMTEPIRAGLATKIAVSFESIAFDRLRVITGPDRTETRSDVEAWQTVAERNLV